MYILIWAEAGIHVQTTDGKCLNMIWTRTPTPLHNSLVPKMATERAKQIHSTNQSPLAPPRQRYSTNCSVNCKTQQTNAVIPFAIFYKELSLKLEKAMDVKKKLAHTDERATDVSALLLQLDDATD
eukprot:Gb_35860 [translate_table: standard]